MVSVSFYNLQTNQFDMCTWMNTKDMDYNGYFVITANTGNQNNDHVYIKSFKLYDPSAPVENFHFQEARKVKVEQEISHRKSKGEFKDLVHMRKTGDLENIDRGNYSLLFQVIPKQHDDLIDLLKKVIDEEETNSEQFFEMMNDLP